MTAWQYASIPFWIIAAVLTFAAIVSIAMLLSKRGDALTTKQFEKVIIGVIALLITAGCFASIAAKISS